MLSLHLDCLPILVVCCSGECDGENVKKKNQGDVGLDMKSSTRRAVRPPKCISDRSLKVTLELCGRAKALRSSWCMS